MTHVDTFSQYIPVIVTKPSPYLYIHMSHDVWNSAHFWGGVLHPNNTANDQPLHGGFLTTSYRIHIPQCHCYYTAASMEMFFQLPPPPHQPPFICFSVYIVHRRNLSFIYLSTHSSWYVYILCIHNFS